jgi:hypothetical protein
MLMTTIARWRDSAARSSSARRADRSRGQVIVIFALFLLVLFGAAALTVDYGTWLKARRDYQNVADPAALAGSVYLTRPTTETERDLARRAAWDELNRQLGLGMNNGQLNGAANNSTPEAGQTEGTYKIWVASPPSQAGVAYPGAQTSNESRTVFVRIERPNPAFLSRTMGLGDITVSAWATAGVFPNRFAIITLREQGMAPGSISNNIELNGSGTVLEAINGDVGGNWNMKLNSGSELWVRGRTDNDAEAYLIEYLSCGSSCWNVGQVNSGPNGNPANATKTPLQLPGVIPDPNYPLPLDMGAPLTPPPNGPSGTAVPVGDDGDYPGGKAAGAIDVRSGGPDGAPGSASIVAGELTCSSDAPRIGPGYYTEISVANGKCLILDPTIRHTSVVADPARPDVPTPVPAAQLPGIFYINGDIDIGTNAMLVGDGVTVIIRPGSSNQMLVSGGGVVDLNRGKTPGGTGMKLGALTTLGANPYVFNSGTGTWGYNTSLDADSRNVGMALYIIKRSQYSSVAVDDNTDVIKINAGAGLAWRGVTYAPHDNVTLSGQPGHDGVGQLVSWTFKFAGGVHVTQEYEGPEDGVPFLIEPRTGQ